ncbi:MAG: hypothetical protein M3Q30_17705 [Actinomycetota bacterium]|nr:hypothetical protein [Actinomycetota bacterium]
MNSWPLSVGAGVLVVNIAGAVMRLAWRLPFRSRLFFASRSALMALLGVGIGVSPRAHSAGDATIGIAFVGLLVMTSFGRWLRGATPRSVADKDNRPRTIAEWWAGLPSAARRVFGRLTVGYALVLLFGLAIRAYLITAIEAGAFLAALLVLRLKLRQGVRAPHSQE